MRGRTALSAVTAGRATFLVAGAALGIGAYGFVATLAPYRSDRVPQPIPGIDVPFLSPPRVSASEVDLTVPVPHEPPESTNILEPQAPLVAATAAPGLPVEPAVEAAGIGGGGVTPLDPPAENPTGTGPVLIDPALVPTPELAPPRDVDLPSGPTPAPSPTPQPGAPAGSHESPTPDDAGPGKGKKKGQGASNGNQKAKSSSKSQATNAKGKNKGSP